MQAEIDYLMQMDESGVIVHEGEAAAINNVTEWMDTPRGQVFGNPAWGNGFQPSATHPHPKRWKLALRT